MSMTKEFKELEAIVKEIQQSSHGCHALTVSFQLEHAKALFQCTKDTGNKKAQDVVRQAVYVYLRKLGYLK